MRVKVGGPLAHAWSDGTVESWTGAVLDVDDADAERVSYFHELAAAGLAEILEPPVEKPPTKAALKAETSAAAAKDAKAEVKAADEPAAGSGGPTT